MLFRSMTAKERENALLFRHYPQTANFRTKVHANGKGFATTFRSNYKR